MVNTKGSINLNLPGFANIANLAIGKRKYPGCSPIKELLLFQI